MNKWVVAEIGLAALSKRSSALDSGTRQVQPAWTGQGESVLPITRGRANGLNALCRSPRLHRPVPGNGARADDRRPRRLVRPRRRGQVLLR
jgi:hypothetical protein